VIALLILAFLGGYLPQRMRADREADALRTTTLDLALSKAHRDLGLAAIEAQRSNYANAGTAARSFFDACSKLAQDPGLANEPRTRGALGSYAGSRDEISVQLASADPQIAQRLASLYLTMDGVLSRRQ
jgi:hypothetical protein